jgi:hypothetical protein
VRDVELWMINDGLWMIDYGFWIMDVELWICPALLDEGICVNISKTKDWTKGRGL